MLSFDEPSRGLRILIGLAAIVLGVSGLVFTFALMDLVGSSTGLSESELAAIHLAESGVDSHLLDAILRREELSSNQMGQLSTRAQAAVAEAASNLSTSSVNEYEQLPGQRAFDLLSVLLAATFGGATLAGSVLLVLVARG